jgi:hypothetical protein
MSGEVGNFLLDLVNIEVNTIIKSGMTAEKMPEPELAIHDVLLDYARFLEQEEVEAKPQLVALSQLPMFEVRSKFSLRGALSEIELLAGVATRQREGAEARPRKAVLDRMLKNLELLREIVDELPAATGVKPLDLARRLTLKQRLLIRKMWEIGTEEVVVQTCISLDGDVVTRIDPQLLDESADLREVLLGVHRESTSVSIRFWSALVSTATNLLGGLGWRSSSSSAPAE